MTVWAISAALGFIAGGAFVYFLKDRIISIYKSTEDQIGALEDKIRALKAKV